jgi:HK97 family phage major capsid protein
MSAKLTERNNKAAELATLRDAETPDEAKIAEVRGAKNALDAELDQLQARVAELEAEQARDDAAQRLASQVTPGAPAPAYDEVARVAREKRTYTAQSSREGVSFFSDALKFQNGDMSARERLERHGAEVRTERELTERATTTGSFAGLVVPQYLVEQAALVARAGRPFADSLQSLQLPDQGTQFQIPKGTTGAATAIQATENSNVQSTDEVWTNVTVNVATIAGQQDVSRQSLERGTPGIDQLIYLDLAGAYAANLDSQCLTGSGASGQLLGVQNTSGINAATAFGAAVSPTNFFLKVAGQVQAIAANRFMAADAIVMHPRRWGWYLGQVATDNRPLAVPNNNGPTNAQATYASGQPYGQVVGALQGLPVITDANIPTNAGTINEDLVFVYRSADLLLWEDGDGMPRELRFEQTLGNQLTVKLVVYGYAAFTAGRYPTAVGKIGGLDTTTNGLVAPTF